MVEACAAYSEAGTYRKQVGDTLAAICFAASTRLDLQNLLVICDTLCIRDEKLNAGAQQGACSRAPKNFPNEFTAALKKRRGHTTISCGRISVCDTRAVRMIPVQAHYLRAAGP
jgi:hypothetical protein